MGEGTESFAQGAFARTQFTAINQTLNNSKAQEMSVQMAVCAPQGLHWLGSSPSSLISFRAASRIALIWHSVQSCCFSALLAQTALVGAKPPPSSTAQDIWSRQGRQGLHSQMWQSSWKQLGSKLPFSKKKRRVTCRRTSACGEECTEWLWAPRERGNTRVI